MTEMEYFYNYPVTSRISERVLDFFCSEVMYALSNPEEQQLWIVSPWIRDVQFSTHSRGDISHLFPNANGAFLTLSEIIKRLMELGATVTLVCLPPHKLMRLQNFQSYIETEKYLARLKENFDEIDITLKAEMEKAPTSSLRTEFMSIRDEVATLYNTAKKTYALQLDYNKIGVLHHQDMLKFVHQLERENSEHFKLVYNQNLHAKIIVGTFGGFFGSANVTKNGFENNDELYAYIWDEKEVGKLRESAARFAKKMEGKYGIHSATQYPAKRGFEIESKISSYVLDQLLEYPFPDEMLEMLELCKLPVSPKARVPKVEVIDERDLDAKEVDDVPASQDTKIDPQSVDIYSVSHAEWEEIWRISNPVHQRLIQKFLDNKFTEKNRTVLENNLKSAYVSAVEKGWRQK